MQESRKLPASDLLRFRVWPSWGKDSFIRVQNVLCQRRENEWICAPSDMGDLIRCTKKWSPLRKRRFFPIIVLLYVCPLPLFLEAGTTCNTWHRKAFDVVWVYHYDLWKEAFLKKWNNNGLVVYLLKFYLLRVASLNSAEFLMYKGENLHVSAGPCI